jgi:hypothetical protein
MEPTQATSVVLAMWHLMMPPAAHVPLSHKWIRNASYYESLEDCERARVGLVARARDLRLRLRLVRESAARDRFHRWQVIQSVCVRRDDPRVAG